MIWKAIECELQKKKCIEILAHFCGNTLFKLLSFLYYKEIRNIELLKWKTNLFSIKQAFFSCQSGESGIHYLKYYSYNIYTSFLINRLYFNKLSSFHFSYKTKYKKKSNRDFWKVNRSLSVVHGLTSVELILLKLFLYFWNKYIT